MFKRLFAYIGLTMLVAFAVVFYFADYGLTVCAATALTMAFVGLFVKRAEKMRSVLVLISIVIAFSSVYFCFCSNAFNEKASEFDGKTVMLNAKAVNSPNTSYGKTYLELAANSINRKKVDYKVMLKTNFDVNADLGDTIICRVILEKAVYHSYQSKNIVYTAKPADYYLDYKVRRAENKGIEFLPNLIQRKLGHAIRVLIPGNEGELCDTISLGDRFALSRDVSDEFRQTGLSHIIVVSGMHMSVIVAFFMLVFRPLGLRKGLRIIRLIIIVLIVLLYMAVTGFYPSVVRSGVMVIIMLVGYYFRSCADIFNSLGIAALVLVLFNPLAVGDFGLILSFASVFGIGLIDPKINSFVFKSETKYYKKQRALIAVNKNNLFLRIKPRIKLFILKLYLAVAVMFSVSFSASIAVFPLSLVYFGCFTPGVVLFSMITTPFLSLIMIFSLIAGVLWFVPYLSVLAPIVAFPAKLLSGLLLFEVKLFSKTPLSLIYIEPRYAATGILIAALIILVALQFRNRRLSVCVSLMIIIVIGFFSYLINFTQIANRNRLRIISKGNGITAVYENNGIAKLLACGGSGEFRREVLRMLHYDYNSIGFQLVPSSDDFDSFYASGFLEEFDVNSVMLYYRSSTNEKAYRLARKCDNYSQFRQEGIVDIELSEDACDRVMSINNHTWQYISADGKTILIAPARGSFDEIDRKYLNADYVVLSRVLDGIQSVYSSKIIWTGEGNPPAFLRNQTVKFSEEIIIDF